MKKIVLLFIVFLFFITKVKAFEVELLANNKEAFSRRLKGESSSNTQWSEGHYLGNELKNKSIITLSQTFNEMEQASTSCDLGLIKVLIKYARMNDVIRKDQDLFNFINFLRQKNLIDDILHRILANSSLIHFKIDHSRNSIPKRPLNLYTRKNGNIDIIKMYQSFKQWPDDTTKCALDAYNLLVKQISYKNRSDRDKQMSKLNYLAYSKEVIDLPTYHKLEILRKHKVIDWPVYFNRYTDIISNAKDKLTLNPESSSDHHFLVEYVSRKEKLTQRESLYQNYTSTQIIMLAQIIEKTAKRMDSKHVSLHWQYTDDPSEEVEIYVFSPMEQYRAAIKMLRKDMGEIMRSTAFHKENLEYKYLIAAAYETGFVRTEELDFVLKFEDFWNPKVPRWKAYTNFALSLTGSAIFYLPPPWNILGAIGLVLTQAKIDSEPTPDSADNWNVII